MWARIINSVLGLWMMIAPSVLGYTKTASNNAHIFGAVITTIAIVSMAESVRDVRKINWFLGGWLVVAPWVLSFKEGTNLLNDTLVGLMLVIFSSFRGRISEKFGGGWKAVFRP